MTLPKLSEGALSIIMKGGTFENPIMQILGSKKIASGSSDKERYRLLLSDGKYLISFAMLSTHINELIVAGELKCNSIIKIKKHITSVINNSGRGDKRVLVILDLELLVPGDTCSKIGSPVQLPDDEISCSSSEQNSTTSNGTKAHPQEERSTVSHNQSSNLNSSLNTSLQDSVIHPISSLSPYQNK
ncbi:replication protein A 70 kDa DNA-binding subunit-like [Agrilus planipennis]|nr:replication protein A 70 kDa DNA-binding subunit-like [Agrilus planipennis]